MLHAHSTPKRALPLAEPRPLYRVASFGLAERFRRLMLIVLNHSQQNRYRYVLADSRLPGEFDIALVDMTVSGGPQIASALQHLPEVGVVVKIGRRDDDVRGRDDLLKQSFTMHLLETLNRFVESFLLARPRSPDPAGPRLVHDQSDSPRRRRVLLVDDSATVRSNLALALQRMGIDSHGVGSAALARRALEARRYELVIVDVVMPQENGFSLTRWIKRDKTLRDTPVVIFSGRSSALDLARGALAGCDSYLVKPASVQSLRSTVLRLVARQEIETLGATVRP
jgi:CheY-like chemotaxis protein